MRARTLACGILSAAILVAITSPAHAATADSVCTRDNPSAPIPSRLIEIEISKGEKIAAATLPQTATMTSCALARWNEPLKKLNRVLVLLENLTANKVFASADITVTAADGAQLTSRQFSINRGETAFYMFVGTPQAIKIAGLFNNQFVSSRTVAIPNNCKPMKSKQLLSALKGMVSGADLALRLERLGLTESVTVVRIGVHVSSVTDGGAGGVQPVIDLSTDVSKPAHIECL